MGSEGVKIGKWFAFAVAGVLSIQALAGWIIFSQFNGWEVRGQFGDMFGAVNAVFSGLAFAGVLLALYMQRKELSLQRKELKLTRDELKGSREAQEKSSEALEKQSINMLAAAIIDNKRAVLNSCQYKLERLDTGRDPYPLGEKMDRQQRLKEKIDAILEELDEIDGMYDISDFLRKAMGPEMHATSNIPRTDDRPIKRNDHNV